MTWFTEGSGFGTISPPRISGLPARLAATLPFLLAALLKLSLSFFRAPSLFSPPEPAASPSLPDPAWLRGRLLSARTVDKPAASGTLRPSVGMRVLRGLRELARLGRVGSDAAVGADDGGMPREGDVGREGVFKGCGLDEGGWCFLCFLREDSVPLASERLGEPGRLRLEDEDAFLSGSRCLLGRFEGVLVPLDDAPEPEGFDVAFPFSGSEGLGFFSSSFLRSASFSRSVSVSSDSLYRNVSESIRPTPSSNTSSEYGLSAESES